MGDDSWPKYEITSSGMPRQVGKEKPIRVSYAGQYPRVEIDLYATSGRRKPSTVCRVEPPLSMHAEPDTNTALWGWGERICLACVRGEPRRLYPYGCPDYDP